MTYLDRLREFAKRNRKIKRLYESGWTKARIAKHYGISRERARQVIEQSK